MIFHDDTQPSTPPLERSSTNGSGLPRLIQEQRIPNINIKWALVPTTPSTISSRPLEFAYDKKWRRNRGRGIIWETIVRLGARRRLRKVFHDKADRSARVGRCDARGRKDKYQDYLFFVAYISTARKCRRNLVSSLDAAGLSRIENSPHRASGTACEPAAESWVIFVKKNSITQSVASGGVTTSERNLRYKNKNARYIY
jgi:hypothetical protein